MWPLGMSPEEVENMDLFIVEMYLTQLCPEMMQINFLVWIHGAGIYKNTSKYGVLNFGEWSLSVKMGHETINIAPGDPIRNTHTTQVIVEKSPIFNYPFDVYLLDMDVHVERLIIGDHGNLTVGFSLLMS